MRKKIPHSPYTTLGMAARRSTKNATGCRSQRGAYSDRKIDTPSASGVAMTSARIDVTIVPKIAGAAPNWPRTGSHSLDVRNPRPKRLSAGHPASATSQKTRPSSNGTHSANPVITATEAASADVRAGKTGQVPSHLRDAHYPGSRTLGHGTSYTYSHDEPYGIAEQQYAPDVVLDAEYYRPTSLGAEAAVKERWERIRRLVRGR